MLLASYNMLLLNTHTYYTKLFNSNFKLLDKFKKIVLLCLQLNRKCG